MEIRTQDPDLGLTLYLWVADLADEFFRREPATRLVVDDDGLTGRPLRNGVADRDRAGCRVVKKGEEASILCTSSALFLRQRPFVEVVRKALVVLGRSRDMTSMDHLQVVRQQRRVRDMVRQSLGVHGPEGRCRFLLRVDDFPSPAAGLDDFLRFHTIAVQHGIPYLLAVTPFLHRGNGRGELADREVDLLLGCTRQKVELALHGFTHLSRYRNYPSELVGLSGAGLRAEVERAEEYLVDKGLNTVGFVAPFNSYNALTLSVLTDRYPLLCGGPESVLSLGYRVGPSFLMERVYVPSYRHAYDVTEGGLLRLDRLTREARGLVVPITIHWANEVRDGFRSFRALCSRLAGATLTWGGYLAQAERARARAAWAVQCQRNHGQQR